MNEDIDAIREDYANLRVAAEMFDDAQHARIVAENRANSMTVVPSPGFVLIEKTGKWQSPAHRAIEKVCDDDLLARYHAIAPPGVIALQEAIPGIGDHLMARLLGQLGPPRIAIPYHQAVNETIADDEFGNADNPKRAIIADEPFTRMVSQLWQYAGHGAPSKRVKGMTQADALALGKPKVKMLVHLIAESCVKCGVRKVGENERKALSDYGQLYLDTKKRYQDRVHLTPCPGGITATPDGRVVRSYCKVVEDGKKRRVVVGEPFGPGHIHGIALRRVGKELLHDMWIAAA